MSCWRFWRLQAIALAAFASIVASGAALACGPLTDCMLGDRAYRIRMPDAATTAGAADRRVPALVFMHGWRGTPDDIMRNREFTDAIAALGVAIVAPKSSQDAWDIPGSPSERSLVELPFFDRLLATLPERHGIDETRLVAAGFSAGGMMVWNLACFRGDKFAAFVPIAGTFWMPLPQTCPTPAANISHVHGLHDPVVPLEGRQIGERFRQGRVADAFALYAKHGSFGSLRPVTSGIADLACERSSNGAGHFLELCTHPGGHIYSPEPVVRVLRESGVLGGG